MSVDPKLLSGSLAALAGVAPGDVDALARVGASALVSGRAELACTVFRGLCALEPEVAEHQLHLAAAARAGGDEAAALGALDRAVALGNDDAVTVAALLLRAELVAKHDREAAKADLGQARALAARSPAARKALEQAS